MAENTFDPDQDGVRLPPVFHSKGIGLSEGDQIRLVAEAAARQIVIEHISLCPFSGTKVEERLRTVESNFKLLIGFMVGSGLLGGAAGGLVAQLLK